ncbi:MAG: putative rane protein [Anaerocolumna sp.]|nr:putative rane protein [Anaerocolumna sp.]
MMMTLLEFRAKLRGLYQKYELYINPVLKFIVSFIVFQLINSAIGYDERLTKLPVVLLLAFISAFTPSAVFLMVAATISFGHVFYISKILSFIIVIIMLIMYLLFLRFTPKLGYAIVAIPILFLFRVPYVVPILLGLFSSPIAILPASCGVIIYYLFQIIKVATTLQTDVSIEDTLQLYTYVANNLITNKQMLLTIGVFALVILVTYFVKRMKYDYAREMAVASGALTCILGFLISNLSLDISNQIGPMILGTLLSAILAAVIQFFHIVLDYSGAEFVQFEDEDYYYYVKAVPKINITTPEINVKRINPQKTSGIRENLTGNRYKEVLNDEDDENEEEYEEYENYTIKNRDKDN